MEATYQALESPNMARRRFFDFTRGLHDLNDLNALDGLNDLNGLNDLSPLRYLYNTAYAYPNPRPPSHYGFNRHEWHHSHSNAS